MYLTLITIVLIKLIKVNIVFVWCIYNNLMQCFNFKNVFDGDHVHKIEFCSSRRLDKILYNARINLKILEAKINSLYNISNSAYSSDVTSTYYNFCTLISIILIKK